MKKEKSDVTLSVVQSTIDQLDEFLKHISKLDDQSEFTLTQATVLERIYLNLIGIRELQSKVANVPHLKSALFLIMRSIISDVLTGLVFDHFRFNKKVITTLNKIHNYDYIKMNETLITERTKLFSNDSNHEKKTEENFAALRQMFTDYYSDNKLITKKHLLLKLKKEENILITDLSQDSKKYEFLKEIDINSALYGLKTHSIYLSMKVYAQYQHFSQYSDHLLNPINPEETTDYLRVLFYLMLSIEQISSNITQAEQNQIEDLRTLVQKNGKAIANIINK